MTVQLLSGLSKESGYPIGTMMGWHGHAAPIGWLLCNGSELAVSSYRQLYNALTNGGAVFPYGANTNGSGGAGSTHFRLPNVTDRFISAPSLLSPAVSGANSNAGLAAGSSTHTHTWDLGLSISASGTNVHSHSVSSDNATATSSSNMNAHNANVNLATTISGAWSGNVATGGGLSVANVLIRTHTHNLSGSFVANHTATPHAHKVITTTNNYSHSHNYTISGNSYTPTSVSHLPPHLSLGLTIILAS